MEKTCGEKALYEVTWCGVTLKMCETHKDVHMSHSTIAKDTKVKILPARENNKCEVTQIK